MAFAGYGFEDLVTAPLGLSWPFTLRTQLYDLTPRFLPKCSVGRGYRAVARNGRILLASRQPLAGLAGQVVQLRLQTWHRAILAGDAPESYGILLHVVPAEPSAFDPLHDTRLIRCPEAPFDLLVQVGGGMVLEFRPALEA